VRFPEFNASFIALLLAFALFVLGQLQGLDRRQDINDAIESNQQAVKEIRANTRADQARQAERRAQACRLFVSEYRNDSREYRDALSKIKKTRDYLADDANRAEAPLLFALIKSGFSDLQKDTRRARREKRDSVPPAYCTTDTRSTP
jgi:uncharacterized membrane protein YccC